MYIFPSTKTLAFPSQVRYSVLIIVFALLALAGCEQDKTADLKARIAKLESQVQAQEQKIEMLANAVTMSRASVFDHPLRQFFEAPEFWEVVYEDEGACHSECAQRYRSMLLACQNEEDVQACERRAAVEAVECHSRYGSSR